MNKKVLIITCVTAILLLIGSVIALAGSPIKLMVNGRTIQSDVDPMLVNGRTMVPIRVVAEALGANVTWDEATNTVIIDGNTAGGESTTNAFIAPTNSYNSNGIDLTTLGFAGTNYSWGLTIDKYSWAAEPGFNIAGLKYNKGLTFGTDCINPYIAYNLGSSYNRLTGYFGTRDDGYGSNKIIIYGDNRQLYESSMIAKGEVPVFIDVDITGVNLLKIQFFNSNESDYFMGRNPVLGNPKLY